MIYLAIWRCPFRSDLDDSSPALCYPVHGVLNTVEPYVSPYYEQYAVPYVAVISPYTKKVQAIFNSKISVSASEKVSKIYFTHAHPFLLQRSSDLKALANPYTDKVYEFYEAQARPLADAITQRLSPFCKVLCQWASTVRVYVLTPVYDKVSYLTYHFATSVKLHVWPKAEVFAYRTGRVISEYTRWVWAKFLTIVSPKISAVYENNVEPQVNKIIDRIFQETEGYLTASTVPPTSIFTASTTSAPLLVSTSSDSTSSASSLNSSKSTPAASNSAKPKRESKPSNEFARDERAQVPLDKKRARRRAISISSELSSWKKIVNKTTRDAFETFKADISKEKERLVKGSKPKFTRLLQKLQRYQQDGFTELRKLVDDMESAAKLYDYPDITVTEDDFPWTPESIQASFKSHAENIRKAAMEVREYSQTFAQLALNRTEDIRSATIDVLDEFSDVALQEIGRKMVSDDDASYLSKAAAEEGKAKWSDWKEFRMLKEHLIQTRQDLIDFDIPMEDINIVLRQAQETANILAKEAAQYLSQLKVKADSLLVLKIKKEEERLIALGKDLPEEAIDDVIYYDELEDDSAESQKESIIKNTNIKKTESTEPQHDIEDDKDTKANEDEEDGEDSDNEEDEDDDEEDTEDEGDEEEELEDDEEEEKEKENFPDVHESIKESLKSGSEPETTTKSQTTVATSSSASAKRSDSKTAQTTSSTVLHDEL